MMALVVTFPKPLCKELQSSRLRQHSSPLSMLLFANVPDAPIVAPVLLFGIPDTVLPLFSTVTADKRKTYS